MRSLLVYIYNIKGHSTDLPVFDYVVHVHHGNKHHNDCDSSCLRLICCHIIFGIYRVHRVSINLKVRATTILCKRNLQ